MIISAVRCDKQSFKEVRFKKGFNIILAERTVKSSKKDSRNGVGKTTLLEIIHFCLGASTRKGKGLPIKELGDWTFILDIVINGKNYSIKRNTRNCSTVKIKGNTKDWPKKIISNDSSDTIIMPVKDWNLMLGFLVFGIPFEITKEKYSISFRSLISYFIRRDQNAFQSPFKYFPQQKEWNIQVSNGFLLGLNWEFASEFQDIKDKEKILAELKNAASQGLLTGYLGSKGELESERITLEQMDRELYDQIESFKVHPQYYKLQEEANDLTKKIHDLTNKGTLNQQILEKYKDSVIQEKAIATEKVKHVYKEAGFIFSDGVLKRLDEVSEFHKKIIANRKEFLKSEINRLTRELIKQKEQIKELSDHRSKLMSILKTHGALQEFTKLQERSSTLKQQIQEIKNRLENLDRFEKNKSSLKISKEELYQKTLRDYNERIPHLEEAIRLFNRFSEELYSEPGRLNIDVTEKGYKFNVEIKRAKSEGIGNMKIFCYDLMLLRLIQVRTGQPGVLIHDSTVFDPVDERQVAKALELAATETEKGEIQYICALNSDRVPYEDFSESFRNRFNEYVVAEFSDATDDGGLLGVRF